MPDFNSRRAKRNRRIRNAAAEIKKSDIDPKRASRKAGLVDKAFAQATGEAADRIRKQRAKEKKRKRTSGEKLFKNINREN